MPAFRRSLAVIIGIDQYGQGIPSLRNAVHDAQAVANLLKDPPHKYEVLPFMNEQASLAALTELLDKTLPAQLGPQDRLLFYFAGHGIAEESHSGPQGYLIPQDAGKQVETFLPMAHVNAALEALTCRHFLLVLDCCFSGAFRWSTSSTRNIYSMPRTLYQEHFDQYTRDPAWQALTSTACDQEALDVLVGKSLGSRSHSEGTEHSPFASALLAALTPSPNNPADTNGDNVILATELYLFLRQHLEDDTKGLGVRQTPGLWPLKKHDKGEFVFLLGDGDPKLKNAPELSPENNPYQGLKPFDEAHHALFFGRNEVVKQLAERIQTPVAGFDDEPAVCFTVVNGVSGCGKSSLVMAGLVPSLRGDTTPGALWSLWPPLRPSRSPVHRLMGALWILTNEDNATMPATFERSPDAVCRKLASWQRTRADKSRRQLLVIDQLEELVTLCSAEEREQFLDLLVRAMQTLGSALVVVATMRLDFAPHFADSPLQPYWERSRFAVPAMTQDELREVIERPASVRAMYFQPPKLVDQIINEVVQSPGALPLLSFTLSEMYLAYVQRKGRDRSLTADDYLVLGGVIGALRNRVDQIYDQFGLKPNSTMGDKTTLRMGGLNPSRASLPPRRTLTGAPPTPTQATMERVMLRMITVDGELTRRRVPLSELMYADPDENTRVGRVIEQLLSARLIVEGLDSDNERYIEPAHDALVRCWNRLLHWKQERVDAMRLQRTVYYASLQWQKHERDRLLLWTVDPRLPQALQLLSGKPYWFNQLEADFVRDSQSSRKRRLLRIRLLWSAVALGLIAFAVTVYFQKNNAQHQKAEAQQRLLQLLKEQGRQLVLSGHPFRALDSLSEAYRQGDGSVPLRLLLGYAAESTRNTTLKGHKDAVTAAAWSPDGSLALTTSADNTAQLWATHGGRVVYTLKDHTARVNAGAFSPDGTLVVTAGDDKRAFLYDVRTGKRTAELAEHGARVFAVAFSPDGRLVATASEDETVKLWNVSGGSSLRTLVGEPRLPIHALSFSPSSAQLAIAYNGPDVLVWSVETGTLVFRLQGHKAAVNTVEFSPDGKQVVTASDDFTAILWDAESGQLRFGLHGHDFKVSSASFSPDGSHVVTTSRDRSARIWESQTGQHVTTLRGHASRFTSAAFSHDGLKVITGSKDCTVRVWEVLSGQLLSTLEGHGEAVTSVAFDRTDARVLSASSDHTAKIWEVRLELPLTAPGAAAVYSAAFSPDASTVFTGGEGHDVYQWHSTSGRLLDTLRGHTDRINAIAVSPSGAQVATASKDGTARLWDASTGQSLQVLVAASPVLAVAFGPASNRVVTGHEDGSAAIWATDTGQRLCALSGHRGAVRSVAYDPSGTRVVTASSDATANLWDAGSGALLLTLSKHADGVHAASFSPDGSLVITASDDQTAGLWESQSGHLLYQLRGHSAKLTSAVFSPDGMRVLTASQDGTAILWSTQTGQLQLALEGHFNIVSSAAFSPDNKLVLTASYDGTAKLWDAQSGDELLDLRGHTDRVTSAAFSPDARAQRVVTTSRDHSARLWDVKLESRPPAAVDSLVELQVPSSLRTHGGSASRASSQ